MLRLLLDAFISLVFEETVRRYIPRLLRYAWMLILAGLTWEILTSDYCEGWAMSLYKRYGLNHPIYSYFIMGFLGSLLFIVYWWGIQKGFAKIGASRPNTILLYENHKVIVANNDKTGLELWGLVWGTAPHVEVTKHPVYIVSGATYFLNMDEYEADLAKKIAASSEVQILTPCFVYLKTETDEKYTVRCRLVVRRSAPNQVSFHIQTVGIDRDWIATIKDF